MLGWIGNIFILIGMWQVGNRWRHAFFFSIVGESFYVARSYYAQDWALFWICNIFLLMALRAWVKWGQDNAR